MFTPPLISGRRRRWEVPLNPSSLSPCFRALSFTQTSPHPPKCLQFRKETKKPLEMQLAPLTTNTTNTNWWIFPSLLEAVNISPSPPSHSGSLLVEMTVRLLVLFACFFLSVYLSVYFPLILSMSSAKMYTLLHSVSIVHPNLLFRASNQKKKPPNK